MFKKLMLVALAICNSYAIEPSKDMGNKDINSITQQMSNITLNNVQSNINNDNNNKPSNIQIPTNQIANYRQEIFDIKKLVYTMRYKKLDADNQDWTKFFAYDMLSKASQKFWQRVIAEKKVPEDAKSTLWTSQGFVHCILTCINPVDVIFDELKYNIDESCLLGFDQYLPPAQLEELKEQLAFATLETIRHWIKILDIQQELGTENLSIILDVYFKREHIDHKDAIETDKKFHKKFHCSICNPSNMQCPICPAFEATTP